MRVHALADTVVRGKGTAGAANAAVAIAPSVFIAVETSAARALIEAGSAAIFGERVMVDVINIHCMTGEAVSAATGSAATLGVTGALSVANAVAQAVLARELQAKGEAALTSSLRSDVVLSAVASTKCVSQATSGTAGTTADAQVSQQAGFAGGWGGTFGQAVSLAVSVVGAARWRGSPRQARCNPIWARFRYRR